MRKSSKARTHRCGGAPADHRGDLKKSTACAVKLCEKVPDSTCNSLSCGSLQDLDQNGDKVIDPQEFKEMLRNTDLVWLACRWICFAERLKRQRLLHKLLLPGR